MLIVLLFIIGLAQLGFLYRYYMIYQKSQESLASDLQAALDQKVQEGNERFYERILKQQSQLKSDILETLLHTLKHQNDQASTNYRNLTETVHKRLQDISKEVDQRLQSSFEKNNAIFHDVVKRLSLIDQAQQKITKLSENVVALQDVLTDKSSRGAFGEVQLEQLVANIIPEKYFRTQETLPNGKRVDCLLILPEPSGHIAIDSKFPLENYQKQFSKNAADVQKVSAAQFRQDVKKHIDDIHERYIIPGFTTDGAMMFVPAEAIFAHIHAHHPEIVAYAHKKKVWMASPTTLMAVLNTALGVIKDHSTRAQVDIIKDHLVMLAKDFERFEKRMDQLARHIGQANKDVDLIQQSSQKITKRFAKIDRCEVEPLEVE